MNIDETRSRLYMATSCHDQLSQIYSTDVVHYLYGRLIMPVYAGYFKGTITDKIDQTVYDFVTKE